MMRTCAAVGAVLAIAGGATTHGADDAWDANALSRAGYFQYWQVKLPFDRGDQTRALALVDDNIYVTTTQGEGFAVHRGAGLLRWVRRLTDPGLKIFAPSHIDDGEGTGPVVFATGSNISIIDRYSGALVQEIPPSFAFGSPAVGDATQVYVGSSDGHFYAMRWHNPVHRRITLSWRVSAGGPVSAAPVLTDADHLYFASQGGGIYCCTPDDKDLNWPPFRTGGAVLGDIHVDESGVYVASTDRSVYRLDPVEGTVRWRRRLPEILRDAPVVVRGTVYQYCPGSGVYAINAEYGDVLWVFPAGAQFAACGGDKVCLVTTAGRLAVVDNNSGRPLAEFALPRKARVAVNREDAAVYVVSPTGTLACAKPEGEPPQSPEEVAGALATLNQPPSGGAGEESAQAADTGDDDTGAD